MRHDIAFLLVFLGAVLLIGAVVSYALVGFWLPVALLALGAIALFVGLGMLISRPPA